MFEQERAAPAGHAAERRPEDQPSSVTPVDALAGLFVDAPPLMKIVEVADTLRMSREGIRKWTTERRVASLKFPKGQGMVRLFRDDVHSLLVRSYGGAATPPSPAIMTVAQLLEGAPEQLSVRECASLLRMTPEGFREWTKQGVLPAIVVPGKVIILRSDLVALLDRSYVAAAA